METNNKRFNSIIMASAVMFLLVVVLSSAASAATLKVGTTGQPYTSVQNAVNDAKAGDTVKVYYGDYDEYVYVYKSIKIQGVASGKKLPKIIGFDIWSSNPTISNFDISGKGLNYGIYIESGSSTISNNKFNVATVGLFIDGNAFKNTKKSSRPKVTNNVFNGCDCGVYIDTPDNPGKLFGFTGNKYNSCDVNIGGSWMI